MAIRAISVSNCNGYTYKGVPDLAFKECNPER
jgi:hypothetical protein